MIHLMNEKNIIHTEFIVKMGQLYYPPKHVDTKEGKNSTGRSYAKSSTID